MKIIKVGFTQGNPQGLFPNQFAVRINKGFLNNVDYVGRLFKDRKPLAAEEFTHQDIYYALAKSLKPYDLENYDTFQAISTGIPGILYPIHTDIGEVILSEFSPMDYITIGNHKYWT